MSQNTSLYMFFHWHRFIIVVLCIFLLYHMGKKELQTKSTVTFDFYIYIHSYLYQCYLFFLMALIMVSCPFILDWRTSFSISHMANLLITPSDFISMEMSWFFPSFLRDSFAVYKNLGWHFFFFQHFKYVIPLSSGLHGFRSEIRC